MRADKFLQRHDSKKARSIGAIGSLAVAALFASSAALAGPDVVSGPGVEPQCFKPWTEETTYLQWQGKEGPYRLALVNGFVGNTWRAQMIKTAKAFVEQPGVKEYVSELKVVSTGTDVAAQLGAIEDFINQGYYGIVTIANSPEGFDRVIRLADRDDVVIVPFDQVLDTDKVMMVNQDQLEIGRISAEFLVEHITKRPAKLLEVRGQAGTSTDRDRHQGFVDGLAAAGGEFEVVEVYGNWDDGNAQKVTADAIATHGTFDGVFTMDGTPGAVRAMIDADHPVVPIAGEAANGFRKMIASENLTALSFSQSPGLVAIALKAAISALQGNPMPQMIAIPVPRETNETLKDGVNFWSDLGDNFMASNTFEPCGVSLTATEIMAKDESNTE